MTTYSLEDAIKELTPKRGAKKIHIDDYIAICKDMPPYEKAECLIDSDGKIIVAEFGHTNTLISVYLDKNPKVKDVDEVWDIIPITASPLFWLVYHTGCVCVWSEFQIVPKELSEIQKESLNILEQNDIIFKSFR